MNLTLPVHPTDYFKEWMDKVRVKLPGLNVHNYSCHIYEVIENLKQLDQAGRGDLKYPLVILLTDIEEVIGAKNATAGKFETATFNFIIANTTVNTYKQPERLENNFRPVLAPIYKALLESIFESKNNEAQILEDIRHQKWERYFWGRQAIFGNDANILTDYVDAIEIKGMQIQLTTKFCQ